MFFRLVAESFVRQRRRKLLAGAAILLGTTAVTAMLALATTMGDRIHRELAVYGANIVITPKADTLEVKVGNQVLKPATGGAVLHESDLKKLRTIFWANNITGVSPELDLTADVDKPNVSGATGQSYPGSGALVRSQPCCVWIFGAGDWRQATASALESRRCLSHCREPGACGFGPCEEAGFEHW